PRLGQLVEADLGALAELFLDDLVAEVDALVADLDAGPGDELLDLLLALPSEGALQQVATVTDACHGVPPRPRGASRTVPRPPPVRGETRGRVSAGSERRRPLARLDHGVEQAVVDGLLGGEDLVALDVPAHLLDRPTAVVGDH